MANDAPERAVEDELLEELPVLDIEGTVESEIVGHPRDVLRSGRLAREELRRVGRNDVEDDVRHDGDGDEEHARPEQAPDQIAEHVAVRAVGWKLAVTRFQTLARRKGSRRQVGNGRGSRSGASAALL